jgi:hypothetical protein
MKTVLTCQQKYHHAKVALTPKDSDYEESEALGLGKAFHQVLEKTHHNTYNETLIREALEEHKVGYEELALLTAMLENYTQYHKRSGLVVVKCELPLETPVFRGFIDALAQGPNGWWIVDLKTAARFDEALLPRLPKDMQLNLYAYFAEEIARALDLKGPFLGARYRVVVKSKAKSMKGLQDGCKVYDVEVPAHLMDPKHAWSQFLESHQTASELANGVAPKKNYNACFDYFRPCEYFSQCHGDEFTKNKNKCKVHTLETVTNGDDLL